MTDQRGTAAHDEHRHATARPAPGHYVVHDGEVFAGRHLLLDLWGCEHLQEVDYIEQALRRAVTAANATLLHIHLHHFGPGCGVSGVAVIAESHISVHTWPERNFAAFDVFMCGAADADAALASLRESFPADRAEVVEARRGLVD